MARVVVTHADEPIGRQIIKTLFHDPDIDIIFALGHGPPPRSFDSFLARDGSRVTYTRLDIAKHRPVNDLFHSKRFRAAEIDTVVHVPRHGAGAATMAPLVAGLADRTAESRLILQHSLELASIDNLVAISSAFVYRLPPGNANRLDEESELDLDPNVIPEIRSWIDCDMIFHGEVHNDRLRVVLLRVPTVVAAGGYVYMNPSLAGRPGSRLRALGFDPICSLVSDKDLARATLAAVKSPTSGIFNIAGGEVVPLSTLAQWTGHSMIPIPGPLLDAFGTSGPHQRFGFTLDTNRAAVELGFRTRYRIGLARAGDGSFRLETASL